MNLHAMAKKLAEFDGKDPEGLVPNPPPGAWPSTKHPQEPIWRVVYLPRVIELLKVGEI